MLTKLKKVFKYFEPLWLGNDGKMSLRSLAAMFLIVDFIINVHNCSFVVTQVLELIMSDKIVDAAVIASLSGYLAQIAILLGIEVALITALLALKAYQGQADVVKTNTITVEHPGQTTTIEHVNP